jgi:hypothetical protein
LWPTAAHRSLEPEVVSMKRRSLVISLSIFVLALSAVVPAGATWSPQRQDQEVPKETFSGTLVGIGGALAGRTVSFTLRLDGRTSRGVALRYAQLLRTKGQTALQRQLEHNDLGSFAVVGQVGKRVNFAYETATPEGRRITVLFERWLQFFELRYGTRSQDYPFSYLELSIDANGKGSGTFIGAAKVYFEKDDPSTLTVENFSTYPLRVVNVEVSRD